MHLWDMNNKSHSAPSFYPENAPDLGQLFSSWFLLSPHTRRGLTLYQEGCCVSICHCICSQGSGRRSGSRRSVEVSGSPPALPARPGHGHSAAGRRRSSPAWGAGISPPGAWAEDPDTPWPGCASPWWSHRTPARTGSQQSGSWICLYTPAGHPSAGSLLGDN